MLKENVILKNLFLFISTIPLCFLVYTLTHLNKLKISIFHPRVLVELSFFIIFLIIGIVIKLKSV
jgi:hypothetical protein